MSRAYGKRTPRIVQDLEHILGGDGDGQTDGERRQEGIGEPRDIPGGLNHLANPPVRRQDVPVPATEWPYRDAMLAHGVQPDEAGHYDRDPRLAGVVKGAPNHAHPDDPPVEPVPVYIVEKAAGERPRSYTGMRRITLPAAGSEPAEIIGADTGRSLVQLLNEDSSHNARFGNLSDLAYDFANSQFSGGCRLPSGATGYTVLRTQGALYAVSETSSTVVISVITEFMQANAL